MREATERLRQAGLRVTRPRLAVLEALATRPHATAEDVARAARAELGALSHQGVYDVLAALTSAGLLRRIEPAGSPARFEARVADNHHHLVCRSCGAVEDVDCAVGAAPCLEPGSLEPAAAGGFVVDEAEVTWWGTCQRCREAATHPQQHPAHHHDETEEHP